MNDLPAPPPNPGRRSRRTASGYVHRPQLVAQMVAGLTAIAQRHRCPLPAEWELGAVWRCPDGHLWVVAEACTCRRDRPQAAAGPAHLGSHRVTGPGWFPATWWQRCRYGGHRATVDMANEHRAPHDVQDGWPELPPALLTPPRGAETVLGVPPPIPAPPWRPGDPPTDVED